MKEYFKKGHDCERVHCGDWLLTLFKIPNNGAGMMLVVTAQKPMSEESLRRDEWTFPHNITNDEAKDKANWLAGRVLSRV